MPPVQLRFTPFHPSIVREVLLSEPFFGVFQGGKFRAYNFTVVDPEVNELIILKILHKCIHLFTSRSLKIEFDLVNKVT